VVDPKNVRLRQKTGHLVLAIWLATVPTLITYGVLSLHGLNICRNLSNKQENEITLTLKNQCDKEAWETTKGYIFLIGFFITLPTWMWFYLSFKKKN
tara:strand:+ start:760 stop:1050 length:291 start_codon:yes stop_codon:yes gene_type:complete